MDGAIEIEALQESIAQVLSSECTHEKVLHHATTQGGPLRPLWDMAAQLGWTALPISEEHGGMGLGPDALAAIHLELGRVAAPLPFLTTMMAATLIEQGGTVDQKTEFLPLIASGTIATLSPPLPVRTPDLSIDFADDEIILSGKARHLVDVAHDGLCVLLAADQSGATYRVILTSEDQPCYDTKIMWDSGHRVSSLTLEGLRLPRTRCFAATADGEDGLLIQAALCLAAEAVGGSEALLALTIGYLGTRQQFGRPLGSFQALKHRIADHQTALVAARALFRSAVAEAALNADDAAQEASSAKALACSVFAQLGRDSIQLHGGIGFTAEYACHIYLKRAHFIAHLFGDETFHTHRAAARLMIGETA